MPEPPAEDPLAALREHVRHAHAAAERLAFSAGGAGGRAGREPTPAPGPGPGPPEEQTPPGGWSAPDSGAELGGELHALVELVESLSGLLPVELREQLYEVVRHILLLIRAVIDWLVHRMQREPPHPAPEVQDIPIR